MEPRPGEQRIATKWWPLFLLAAVAALIFVTATSFSGTFRSAVPVTLTSDRSGLVLETGAKVKLRGVDVGRVSGIEGGQGRCAAATRDRLRPDPVHSRQRRSADQRHHGIRGEVRRSGLSRAPAERTPGRGSMLRNQCDDRGQHRLPERRRPAQDDRSDEAQCRAHRCRRCSARPRERIGQATTALNEVLTALNARNDIFRDDIRSLKDLSETYSAAAEDIVSILDSASTVSTTVVNHQSDLDNLLLKHGRVQSQRDRPTRSEQGQPRNRDKQPRSRRPGCSRSTALLHLHTAGREVGRRPRRCDIRR